jgi:predicted DNA-binding transcriptional regulator AlpA
VDSRWLNLDELAAYVGVKEHQIRRMVRAGKLPEPSLHLGPRSPRWDREQIDALFTGGKAKSSSHVREAVNAILQEGAHRKAQARGRQGEGIPLPAEAGVVSLRR